jgi:phenylacetate-coenzyme A ligase PaaK-like adenylate-forming protein
MAAAIWITLRKLREFRRNEKLTRGALEALKLAKFRRLATLAGQRSSYYAQIIAERGIDVASCTPADFPVLTKSVLMANFDRIVTDPRITRQSVAQFLTGSSDPNELLLGEYHVVHTSGSSGEVGYFVYSDADWTSGMAQAARRTLAPEPSKKRQRGGRFRMAFYGATGGHFAGVSMVSGGRRGISRLFVEVGLFEINSPLPQVISQLNDFQPDYLAGYTTGLKILAEKQRQGELRIAPRLMNAGGESMSPADKAELEAAFQCEAVSGYGCTEHLMMGRSIPGSSSMMLYDDDLIFEFHADHCVITNLFNSTLPLIRYRMSDILRPVAKPGTALPYIEIDSLVGRTELVPTFVNRDGVTDFISPHTINELFVAGVTRFQLQLMGNDRFRFMVCLDAALSTEQRGVALAGMQQRLREVLDQKLMDNVTFEVIVVADLPPNPRTRKFQLIVDARSNQSPGQSPG